MLAIASINYMNLATAQATGRAREVGVRKVLGASVSQMIVLLGKDFLRLVLIAGLVAAPIALWLAHQWLARFAYKTNITLLPFLATLVMAMLVAIVTVSSRAWRAAHANPVDSLRNE